MKIPVEWLSEYVDIDKPSKKIADSFTALGLLLDKPIEKYKNGAYSTDVLDLEHRMDRSDWLSLIGCARDLAAFERLKLKDLKVYEKKGKKPSKDQIVDIQVECPDLVNRFTTVVFRGVKVKESPNWLKNRLEAYGIPSKNNIVDITNYVMVELGQTMHAQDLDKMEAQEIVIRRAKTGEKVTTLLGETVELNKNQFVLTQKGIPTVIGGIVGGESTAVDKTTTNIILDAGNYNQNNIRNSSRKLKIQNESVLRNDKFVHPYLTEVAIKRATQLILEVAGGEYYENIDWYPKVKALNKMRIRYKRIKQISGMDIKQADIKRILTDLEYKVLNTSKEFLEVEIPYFRTDVVVEDDIVADILRINNYANVPLALVDKAPPKEITPEIYRFEDKLRDMCVNLGLHEHITDPLVSRKGTSESTVILENALSEEKSCLRTTIYTTLFPVTVDYLKRGYSNPEVFEIGKTYHKNKTYKESRELEIVIGGNEEPHVKSNMIKKLLEGLLNSIGIEAAYKKESNKIIIVHAKTVLGELRYDSLTLYTEQLMANKNKPKRVITEIDEYHTEDLSLILDVKQQLGDIYQYLNSHKNVVSVDVEEDSIRVINREQKRTVLIRVTYRNNWDRAETIKALKSKYSVLLRA